MKSNVPLALTFHQTFSLRLPDLARVVKCVADRPEATNQDIASETGLGIGKNPQQGKIQPYLEYAMLSGLLGETQASKGKHTLTEAGQIILMHDPHFETMTSAWAIHINLAHEGSRAGAWGFLFNNFLHERTSFSREELRLALQEEFGHIAKVSSINDGVLLNSYLKKEGLQRLGLLEEVAKGKYLKGLPQVSNPYIVGYALARLWQIRYRSLTQITAAELLTKGGPCDLLCLSAENLQNWLDELTRDGLLIQHRAVSPSKVERVWDKEEDFLLRAYSEYERA